MNTVNRLKKHIKTLLQYDAKIWGINRSTIMTIISMLESRDRFAKGHLNGVAKYALCLAKEVSLNQDEAEALQIAAMLHDIGKIVVPVRILNKPGPLSPREYEIIKTHVAEGVTILKPFPFLRKSREIMAYHHEWYDGKGYPNALSGQQIPLGSRILSIADAYEAMTSNRSYRKAMTKKAAKEELARCSGTQFDKRLVGLFLKHV